MMDTFSFFTSLGFTEYEAKVYLALLDHNPATGYQISKQSGVPRSMVYEALGRLNQRGAVLRADEGRANLYRPIPPDALLDRIEHEHHQVVGELRKRLKRKTSIEGEDLIWRISGRSAIISYAIQMIQQAQKEIYTLLHDADFQVLQSQLAEGTDRGVKVAAVLTGQASFDLEKFRDVHLLRFVHHPPRESELQQLSRMSIVVIDSQECLIADSENEHGLENTKTTNHLTATITRNQKLVFIARQFLWMELFTQQVKAKLGTELIDMYDYHD